MTVFTLEIEHGSGENRQVLHPVLLKGEEANYLVDCGYQEDFEAIIAAMETCGVSVSELDAILLTHDDIDHLGGLWRFRQAKPGIKVWCSRLEAPAVSGRQKSERLKQAEDSFPYLPAEFRSWALDFMEQLKAIKRSDPDGAFEEGDLFGEARVVHTPGHTSGHVSFYLPAQKILIAGDAVVIESGKPAIANPQFTLNLSAALQSVKKLAGLDIEKLICYHGGVLEGDIPSALKALARQYEKEG